MTSTFNRITYEDQLFKLEKAGEWLTTIGIQFENTRFDEVLNLNRQIVEHYNRKLVKELISEYGNLKLWFALTEASSFIEIYEAFHSQKSHKLPRGKLKMLLQGPYHSWDESASENNIEPRNTLFELEAAAKFKKIGVEITGFDDIDFVFRKTKFNVQCKRLHSEKKFQDNIKEAANQFYKRMGTKSNRKGIICLSVDKLTGTEEMILKVKSLSEIDAKIAVLANSIFNKYNPLWHNLLNINILAVLLFVHVVASIEDEPSNLLTTCRDIAFDVLPRQTFYQITDYDLITKLGDKLKNADV